MTEKFNDRVCNSENATRYIKQRVSSVTTDLDEYDDDSPSKNVVKLKPALLTSIVAGGIAGVVVDTTLYPLDTIKTRLQSPQGFRASGGFRGIYKGIIPVLMCSAPISSLFFAVYNTTINTLKTENQYLNPFVYIASASVAEIVSSTLRIPLEIVKQRKQVSDQKSIYIIRQTFRKEGVVGFYRGFWSTLWREIPFAAIQYPLWEIAIHQFIIYQKGAELTAFQSACCGALAGGIAGIVTTPMDVIKTTIMLEDKENLDRLKKHLNLKIAGYVLRKKGLKGLFAGVCPRFLWITTGGFIYFGAYEKATLAFEEKCNYITKALHKLRESAPSQVVESVEQFFLKKLGLCGVDKRKKKEPKDVTKSSAPSEEEHDRLEKAVKKREELQKEEQDTIDDLMESESGFPVRSREK